MILNDEFDRKLFMSMFKLISKERFEKSYLDNRFLLNFLSYWAMTVREETNEQSEMHVCFTEKEDKLPVEEASMVGSS